MRQAIVIVVAALGVLAGCGARSATSAADRLNADTVRAELLRERPSATAQINALTITNEDGLVTLRGVVDDEPTHDDLVNRVRAMSSVRGVRDEIRVEPGGTTTTTGADVPGQSPKQP